MAVVPVFVSSTFRDFHGERDILAGPVRERLDELVAPLGIRVELIDLRWGVDTLGISEEEAARKVLDVCLAEVQRARPLFMGLVGARYGYVPEAVHAHAVAGAAGVPESQSIEGLSVTALEFGLGLLWESAPEGDHLVVFRDLVGQVPDGWADSDPTDVRRFRDEVAEKVRHRDSVVVVEYTAEVGAAGAALDAVRSAGRKVSFEDLMVGLLAGPVVRQAEEFARVSEAAGTSGSERLFRDDHALMVGRDEMVAEVVSAVVAGERVVLVGESGTGKSTVVCAVEDALRGREVRVVSALLGASTVGASARVFIEHITEQLVAWTGRDIAVPENTDVEELSRWWRDTLTEIRAGFGEFVLVVDALDAFSGEPERSDVWPVRRLPAGVGLVVSTTSAAHAQILVHEGARRVEVGRLSGRTAAEAAEMWTRSAGRSLPEAVLALVAGESRVPLWVRLAVDLLGDLDADDFAAIAHEPDQAQAIADLLTAEARMLPGEPAELVEVFLDTVSARLDSVSATVLLGALAVSPSGLAPADLGRLLQDSDAQIKVATLRRVLGGQLRESDVTGRLTFSHGIVRDAAVRRAPADVHQRIVAVLGADDTWDATDALDALWHAISSGDVTSAPVLARALNLQPAGTEVTLIRALRSHSEGFAVVEALEASSLSQVGLEALLKADETWGGEYLQAENLVSYAQRVLAITREASALAGERLVMWAAGNVGKALFAVGNVAGARVAFEDQLVLARQLREIQPDAMQGVRDVSVSLDNVGRVLRAVGDLSGARVMFEESLALRRQLREAQPGAVGP
ncbi:DUF4062 domain-containing protein, partial [Gordonia phosphorivorans]